MRPALDPAGHRFPRTKPTCLLHTWRPHRQRPFALVVHLHQHESSRNLHLQYLAKNQSTQRCQSLITQGSDHPPVLKPHMVLKWRYPRLLPLSTQDIWDQFPGASTTTQGSSHYCSVLTFYHAGFWQRSLRDRCHGLGLGEGSGLLGGRRKNFFSRRRGGFIFVPGQVS
jgi:hypothetical protein